jgi:hypothetical protein
MAFTGRLGTSESQLGRIVLGSTGEDEAIQAIHFTLDAVIRSTREDEIALDAVLLWERTYSAPLEAWFAAPAQEGSFDLDAVVTKTTSATFEVETFVAGGTIERSLVISSLVAFTQGTGFITISAYVAGVFGHSRHHDHFGSQPIDVITYQGVPLNVVLFGLYGSLNDISAPHFSLNAIIKPYLLISATIHRPTSGTMFLEARMAYGSTLSINAAIHRIRTRAFGINAYMVSL